MQKNIPSTFYFSTYTAMEIMGKVETCCLKKPTKCKPKWKIHCTVNIHNENLILTNTNVLPYDVMSFPLVITL